MKTPPRGSVVVLVLIAALAATAVAAAPAYAGEGVLTATLSPGAPPRPLSLAPLVVRSLPWQPLVDTYVYQRTPAVTNGRSRRLLAGRDRLGYEYWTLLRFKTSDLGQGYEPYVHRADLRLWLVSGGRGPMITGLAGFKPLIYENTTWFTKPGVKWLPELTQSVSGSGRWVSVPVTDLINRSVAYGTPRDDLIVSGSSPGAVWSFASNEEPYVPHRPRIDVVYTRPKPLSAEMRDATVTAGSSEVVTATVTQDLGAPWAGTDVDNVGMYVQGSTDELFGSLASLHWFRDRPSDIWAESTAAPGGGWFASAKSYAPANVTPRYDLWTRTVSPDGRKVSVTFAWTITPESRTGEVAVQGFATARPPGGTVARTVGVYNGDTDPDGARLHIVPAPD